MAARVDVGARGHERLDDLGRASAARAEQQRVAGTLVAFAAVAASAAFGSGFGLERLPDAVGGAPLDLRDYAGPALLLGALERVCYLLIVGF